MTELLVETSGTVVTLTLSRPEKMNALSAALIDALIEAVDAAERRQTTLLVIRGEGRNFSAGFDFGGFEEQSEGDLVLRFIRIEHLLQKLFHAPFDTLALAHGKNFGAGVDIICSCARRIAAPGTTFQMPGLRFGLVLGTRRYAARVGNSLARHVLQEGIAFDSAGALNSGFLTEVADPDDWPERTADAVRAAAMLSADAKVRLFSATTPDTRDVDLADLVRSAALPGLKDRIRSYRRKSAKLVSGQAADGVSKRTAEASA
jgi:enoyl-CoA hydratase/carnithine racemase